MRARRAGPKRWVPAGTPATDERHPSLHDIAAGGGAVRSRATVRRRPPSERRGGGRGAVARIGRRDRPVPLAHRWAAHRHASPWPPPAGVRHQYRSPLVASPDDQYAPPGSRQLPRFRHAGMARYFHAQSRKTSPPKWRPRTKLATCDNDHPDRPRRPLCPLWMTSALAAALRLSMCPR